MIYGFVRQSGGQVRIHSEVGTGTTMRLYLPRLPGEHELADRNETATNGTARTTGDGPFSSRMKARSAIWSARYCAMPDTAC